MKKFIDVPLVKVLSGVRRCGKSTILDMIKAELVNNRNIKSENIISRKYKPVRESRFKSVSWSNSPSKIVFCSILLNTVQL